MKTRLIKRSALVDFYEDEFGMVLVMDGEDSHFIDKETFLNNLHSVGIVKEAKISDGEKQQQH